MSILVFLLLGPALLAQGDISGARIRPHVKFLSSDLLEGRGVGLRGGELAVEYLATQFELAGLKPAGDHGTYRQRVPLVGVDTAPETSMTFTGATRLPLRWLEDFVGHGQRQRPLEEFEAETVFVGHGIHAPEHRWDDFKGMDVRGKVLVLFTNEPRSDDPRLFGGRALTYYGRWTYKFEEAARRGALGAIIIHTTPTAGYGYDVVRSSWGREDTQVKLAGGQHELAFAGWVTQAVGEKLLAMAGKTLDSALAEADSPGFQPQALPFRVRLKVVSRIRPIETYNVAGLAPGADPKLASEAVIFSAHWDHLGMAEGSGDRIYNGAVDNATGCGMLIEMARSWAALRTRPKRSALFLAVTAEEGGLRGSAYYAANPLIPAGKTSLNLNFDAFYPFGRTRDVVVTGAERTTVWPIVQEAAKRMNLQIKPDPRPEQGSYYRSDHFSMARAGIPAFSIHGGNEFAGKPPGYGDRIFAEYNQKHYHQPSDEYQEDWDFSGMEQMAQFGFIIGLQVANLDRLPTWRDGDEFLEARRKSGVQ